MRRTLQPARASRRAGCGGREQPSYGTASGASASRARWPGDSQDMGAERSSSADRFSQRTTSRSSSFLRPSASPRTAPALCRGVLTSAMRSPCRRGCRGHRARRGTLHLSLDPQASCWDGAGPEEGEPAGVDVCPSSLLPVTVCTEVVPAAARLWLEAIKQLPFHFFRASTADLASPCTPAPLLKENQKGSLSPGFLA